LVSPELNEVLTLFVTPFDIKSRASARKQIESCYPQFAKFLQLKKKYDPEERLQSDWYRHYRTMFADSL